MEPERRQHKFQSLKGVSANGILPTNFPALHATPAVRLGRFGTTHPTRVIGASRLLINSRSPRLFLTSSLKDCCEERVVHCTSILFKHAICEHMEISAKVSFPVYVDFKDPSVGLGQDMLSSQRENSASFRAA